MSSPSAESQVGWRGTPGVRTVVVAFIVAAVLMSVAFPIVLVVLPRNRIVNFVTDDAYYYFNIASRIAVGAGPTADGITRTTGFHPLYGFLLAGVFRLIRPTPDGFVGLAIALGALCFLGSGLFVGLAARRWWGPSAGIAAALLWYANPHNAKMLGFAMESGVFALTLSLLLWQTVAFLDGTRSTAPIGRVVRSAVWLGLCGGLAALSRTDSLLLMPMLALVLAAGLEGWRRRVLVVGVVAATVTCMIGLWWVYAWVNTGSIVQGSAAIKAGWREFRDVQEGTIAIAALAGAYVLKSMLKAPALKYLVLTAGSAVIGRERGVSRGRTALGLMLCATPLVLGVAYAVATDRPRTWYYVPSTVMLTILSGGAIAAVADQWRRSTFNDRLRRALPWVGGLVLVEVLAIFGRDVAVGLTSDPPGGLAAAEWLNANIDPGERVGCWHSGMIQYYTPNVDVINLDGLANNEIQAVMRGEKTMNQYWDERGISVIVGKPRAKMGGFDRRWDGKRLEVIDNAGLIQRVVADGSDGEATPRSSS